jgi:YbbR domain-containing protein
MSWKPKHLGWKLGSLLLAVLLWIAISGQPDAVTQREIPLLFRNLPGDLLITGDPPQSVRIELRGAESRLTSTTLAETVAVFDLSGVHDPSEQTFTVSTTNLNLPEDVAFLRAVPSQFRLRFARLKSKEVPVEIRLTGALPEGWHLKSRSVVPDRLRVAGSETRIESVRSVETDPIDLGRITASGIVKVNTFISEPQVHFESSPVVTVSLVLEK